MPWVPDPVFVKIVARVNDAVLVVHVPAYVDDDGRHVVDYRAAAEASSILGIAADQPAKEKV